MRRIFVALMILAPTYAHAECNVFRHETNDKVTVTLEPQTVILDNDGEKQTMLRVITKPFGQLVELAAESDKVDSQVHYFAFMKFGKVEKLVFDAQVFVKACKK